MPVEFAKMAESSGAAFVTVHGRTRMQMYSGTADWDKIAEVVNAVRIPVIGNGDVFSGTDAAALAARTGARASWPQGAHRGIPSFLRKSAPRFAEKITFPLPPAQGLTLRFGIFRNTLPLTGTAHSPICASILPWYTKGMYGSTELRRRVNNCGSTAELSELVRRFRDEVSD